MTTFPYYKYGNPQNYRKWRGKGILKFRINKLELPQMFEPMTFDAVFPAYIQTCYFLLFFTCYSCILEPLKLMIFYQTSWQI